ncbi:unnamed protein product [Arctia plantaginis]|uniref:Protein HEXIM1 n=1 Tax=Arctia plantaginis TaxID=874455 RepID=A0A8S1AVB1_ARCPL|nr:unnamed protein product [Arctia plantaginis]CAB3248941.1 unnamed protein product [Arctia plantaginis]
MEENTITTNKDGDARRPAQAEAPSAVDLSNIKLNGNVRKKRRRGKSKRKLLKPFAKNSWLERRNEKSNRNNRFRKLVLAKTHAPFNNNQFLMEIHKPEPENAFHSLQTPSARTRDSSFSVDSEDNYFYSLPEDEEEYLTKEFSSVYEDAQSERLSSMSKDDLIQEYLLLEAKYDNLLKRTERSKGKCVEDDKETVTDKDASVTDRDSMITDKDTSLTSLGSSAVDENSFSELMQKMKEQEDQIHSLQLDNEKLRVENEHLRQRSQTSSSADSESDSSSSSDSDSSSNPNNSPIHEPVVENNSVSNENHIHINGQNEETDGLEVTYPIVNGTHD